MLYVKSQKSFKMKRQEKFIILLCARIQHMAKSCFTMCHEKTYGKVFFFAVCKKKYTAKHVFAMCYIFAVCAHGKEVIYCVSDRKHVANYRAHSGSATVKLL